MSGYKHQHLIIHQLPMLTAGHNIPHTYGGGLAYLWVHNKHSNCLATGNKYIESLSMRPWVYIGTVYHIAWKFGNSMSSWKPTRFKSLPDFQPLIHYSCILCSYILRKDVEIAGVEMWRIPTGRIHNSCTQTVLLNITATVHKDPLYWLSTARSWCIHRMIAANAAIDFMPSRRPFQQLS